MEYLVVNYIVMAFLFGLIVNIIINNILNSREDYPEDYINFLNKNKMLIIAIYTVLWILFLPVMVYNTISFQLKERFER